MVSGIERSRTVICSVLPAFCADSAFDDEDIRASSNQLQNLLDGKSRQPSPQWTTTLKVGGGVVVGSLLYGYGLGIAASILGLGVLPVLAAVEVGLLVGGVVGWMHSSSPSPSRNDKSRNHI